jgi:hypothetical protein
MAGDADGAVADGASPQVLLMDTPPSTRKAVPVTKDQRPATSLDHRGHLVLGAQECAGEVDVHHLTPLIQPHGGHFARGTQRARVVGGDVKATKVRDGPVDQALRERFITDVSRHGSRVPAHAFDFIDQSIELCGAPRRHDNARTFVGKQKRGCAPNAGTGARDDGDLVQQTLHDLRSSG